MTQKHIDLIAYFLTILQQNLNFFFLIKHPWWQNILLAAKLIQSCFYNLVVYYNASFIFRTEYLAYDLYRRKEPMGDRMLPQELVNWTFNFTVHI